MSSNPSNALMLCGLLALASCASPASEQVGAAAAVPDRDGWIVSVGERIPALELTDDTGRTRSLDEFLGKPVVLLFWGST